ncbi:MAG: NfeD family protein [Prevotellaceae bacterium]|jgi:membrane-bound ClpP family serine protease|nr:NfeD family protein [Prevotellaceae bacterium]
MGLIITLIVIGIVLLLLELLVIPGFGVTGILGIAALTGGIVLSYTTLGTTAGHLTLFLSLAGCGVALWVIMRSKTWNRISLKTNIDDKIDVLPEEKGVKTGDSGIALTRLAPMGKIRINTVDVEATSREGIINTGQTVEVVKIDGAKIIVKTKDV